MAGVHWLVAGLAVSTVAAGTGFAHARGWIPGVPSAFEGRAKQLQSKIDASERRASEATQLQQTCSEDLLRTKSELKQSRDDVVECETKLETASTELSEIHKVKTSGSQALVAELRKLFPGEEVGYPDVEKMAAFLRQAVQRTFDARDRALKDFEATSQRESDLKKALEVETDGHRRTGFQLDEVKKQKEELRTLFTAEQQSHREDLARAATEKTQLDAQVRRANATIEDLEADVARLKKNVSLRLQNTGSGFVVKWAVLVSRDRNGGIRSQEIATGQAFPSGETTPLGEGIAVVGLAMQAENPANTAPFFFAVGNAGKGSGDFSWHP